MQKIMCCHDKEDMEHKFGEYLVSNYWGKPCIHKNLDENTRVAVIVETRDAFFLPLVIANAVDKLGTHWNLHVIAPSQVLESLHDSLPQCEFASTKLGCPTKITTRQYSALLRKRSFWNRIREGTILIFQLDVVLLRGVPSWAEAYDYIGAPCGSLDSNFVINGGLSLRSKSAMLQLCGDESMTESEPEDIYFTRELRNAGATLPSIRDAVRFACESIYDKECCGVHGTCHYFLPPETIAKILEDSI